MLLLSVDLAAVMVVLRTFWTSWRRGRASGRMAMVADVGNGGYYEKHACDGILREGPGTYIRRYLGTYSFGGVLVRCEMYGYAG
jgi:hypothetical protein